MPFKIAVLNKSCDNVLLEGGNGAGVKSEALVKSLDKLFGQNHISYAQGRGNGLGEGIKIDHVVLVRKRKQGILGLCGNRNSDSKSSSMIYRSSVFDQRMYSCLLLADAETPVG